MSHTYWLQLIYNLGFTYPFKCLHGNILCFGCGSIFLYVLYVCVDKRDVSKMVVRAIFIVEIVLLFVHKKNCILTKFIFLVEFCSHMACNFVSCFLNWMNGWIYLIHKGYIYIAVFLFVCLFSICAHKRMFVFFYCLIFVCAHKRMLCLKWDFVIAWCPLCQCSKCTYWHRMPYIMPDLQEISFLSAGCLSQILNWAKH